MRAMKARTVGSSARAEPVCSKRTPAACAAVRVVLDSIRPTEQAALSRLKTGRTISSMIDSP